MPQPDPRRELAWAMFDERALTSDVQKRWPDVPERTVRDWRRLWKAKRGKTTKPARARDASRAPTPAPARTREVTPDKVAGMTPLQRVQWQAEQLRSIAAEARAGESYGPAVQAHAQLAKLGVELDRLKGDGVDPFADLTDDELEAAAAAELMAMPYHLRSAILERVKAASTPTVVVDNDGEREVG